MKKGSINDISKHDKAGLSEDFISFFSFLLRDTNILLLSKKGAKVEKQQYENLLRIIDVLLTGTSWLMLSERVEIPVGSIELARELGFEIQKESSVYHAKIPAGINLFLERSGRRLRIHYYAEFQNSQASKGTIEFEFDKFVNELLRIAKKHLIEHASKENMVPSHLNEASVVLEFYKWISRKWNNETLRDIHDKVSITTTHLHFEIYLNKFNVGETFNPFPVAIWFDNYLLVGACQETNGEKKVVGIPMEPLYVFNELLYAVSWIMEPDSSEGGLYAGELRKYVQKLGFSVGNKNPLYLVSFGCCSTIVFERENDNLLIHYHNSLRNCDELPNGTIEVPLKEFIEDLLKCVFAYLTRYMDIVEKIRASHGQKPEEYACNELWSNYKYTLRKYLRLTGAISAL